MAKLTSIHNDRVRRVQALQRSTRRRDQEGVLIAEGVRLVQEVVATRWPVAEVFYTSDFAQQEMHQPMLTALQQQAESAWEVDAPVFSALSDTQTPQGILLTMPHPKIELPTHLSLTLIPDGVRDPGNMGTMLRTAWAVGVSAVLVPPGTVDVTNPKVVRAGMGAHFHIPIVKADWATIRGQLTHAAVWLAEAGEGTPYDVVPWCDNVALIVGSEAHGAGDEGRALAGDNFVVIPMAANVDSLNAGVATAVLLFEAARQRRKRN